MACSRHFIILLLQFALRAVALCGRKWIPSVLLLARGLQIYDHAPLKGSNEEGRKEERAGRIYFSRISINRGIFSLDSGIDPVKKKKKEEWRKCNYKLFHVEVLEIENIAKISSIDNIKIRRFIYINKLIKFLIILPRIKKW